MHGGPLPATSVCSATPSLVAIFLGPLWTTTGLSGLAAAAGSSRRTVGLLWHATAPAITARAAPRWMYSIARTVREHSAVAQARAVVNAWAAANRARSQSERSRQRDRERRAVGGRGELRQCSNRGPVDHPAINLVARSVARAV